MQKATQANWKAGLRTTILLATLTGLLVGLGYLIGGPGTAAVFLFIALAFNLVMFWFSDKIALRMSRAQPLSEEEAPRLHQMVRELSHSAGIPMPRLYMIPQDQPNAFATGRSPKHSAVAVTRGITQLLSESELRGVIAHELAHIKQPRHPDHDRSRPPSAARSPTWATCCCSWAATTTARSGSSERWRWCSWRRSRRRSSSSAISRQREYAADATGARISGSANALADALERLQAGAQAMPMQVNQAAEPLYIVKPFSGGGMASLFSTHPPIEERVRRLRELGV